MSRSYCTYDEDWQRRKSVLIRSLFHDIPILSPVEEESNESSHDYYVPSEKVFPSPPRLYSPLPPLIIEKIPITNKHDEPEEYYRKLHKKIKKIYEKLFLENRNESSVDLDSNYNDCSVNDDSEYNTEGSIENQAYERENNSPKNGNFESIIEDREATESSASTNSNGYGADFESMDTSVIDVVNRTVSNEDIIMISEEEKSENENVDDDSIRYEDFGNCRSRENKAFSTERMDNGAFSDKEESHRSTVNDRGTTESEKSDETEIGQNYEAEGSDSGIKADRNSNNQEERIGSGGIKKLIASNDEPMEADVETSQSSEGFTGPHYRQITTEALVHFDGYQVPGDRESIVYEDSVKSIILPTRYRRMLASRIVDVDDRIEVYTELEENADPKNATTFDFDENETTEEDLEEVTTSHSDTTLENDEEKSAGQRDDIEEDNDEMSAPQSNASDRKFKEIGTCQPGAVEDDDEERRGRQSDDSEEVDTNQPDGENETEERRNLDSDNTEEENEAWQQTNDAGEDVGQMGTPGLDTLEKDDQEMSTQQAEKEVEVDIEETGTLPPNASGKKTEEISIHQPVADEQNEAKRAPQQDEYNIYEMSPNQRDLTIDATFEKESANPNIMDQEIRTDYPGTNEEEMRTSQTEVTGEKIEKMRTPRPKADKKQMRTKVLESTVIEMKIHQPAAIEDVEEMESPHSIELMRTPRPDLSHGTIPITQRSCSESTTEHTALPQELTVLTSSTQDGTDNNLLELQTSHDMNAILTSIFNESPKDGTPISGTKRKLVDKSVQAVETSKLTWEEMRANFFVGTPKIFRLCACTDHICS